MRLIAISFLFLVTIFAGGCTRTGLQWLEEEPVSGPVWPGSPAEPRIQYLGSIRAASEAGLGGSTLRSLTEAIFGRRSRMLHQPSDVITIDHGRFIIIADPGVPAVHVLEPSAGRWEVIEGKGESALNTPVALAADGTDGVWITDSAAGLLLRLDLESGRMEAITKPGVLIQPVGVVMVGADSLVVVDTAMHRLTWLTRKGEVLGHEGGRGSELGEFNYPTMIAVGPGGEIVISDTLNFRIQIRDRNGSWSRTVSGPGDGTGYMSRPKGVGVDRWGNMYVLEGFYSNLSIFDFQSGEFNLAIGHVGEEPGEFRLPVGLHLDGDNRIFIADSRNSRIQVFRYVGADE